MCVCFVARAGCGATNNEPKKHTSDKTHLLGFYSTQGRRAGFFISIFVDGTNLNILKCGNAEKIRHRRYRKREVRSSRMKLSTYLSSLFVDMMGKKK